ncbi:MAG: carboxypeptidase-like regulatory domain-containing protein [Bacteroidales bacterium]|nr:carboxypeptidase-like regulatory domain-containing protein [Candidatus Colicola faecequi]
MRKFFLTYLLMLSAVFALQAQTTSVQGTVVDAQTGETLPFVQIYFIRGGADGTASTVGTTSDMDGRFSLGNSEGFTTVLFQMMGYKTEMLTLRQGQQRKNITVKLEPDVYALQDIVVTPKHRKQKYKRKGNPAVELAKAVIAHKDSANAKQADHYTADTYSRMSFALDNFHPDFKKRFWRSFAFAEKYIDTTGVYPSMVVSVRENLAHEYFQRKPHREKRIIDKHRIFGLEDEIKSDALKANVDAIFSDFDIYDDNMDLLSNRFVSPLSSTLGTAYYQYYIMDTLMMDGQECIDLAFVPVNSESYSFTGHLYVVNDSTYKLKRYAINIPPAINLNFVSDFSIDHSYKQLPNGLWAPDRTATYAKFYIANRKRGVLARQTKLYTGWNFDDEIDKHIFSSMTADEAVDDTSAVRIASRFWADLRPEPLSFYEESVYDLVNEFLATPKFHAVALVARMFSTEFLPSTNASLMNESKFDFGPVFSTVSWNMLEGVRLRFGGMTTANLNKHAFFRFYTAFGTKDLRPKYGATFIYSFNEKKYHPYEALRDNLSFSVNYDVEEPGQTLVSMDRDVFLMSIPTSTPQMKNYQYLFRAQAQYHKDFQNRLTLKVGLNFEHNEPAGRLRYQRVTAYSPETGIQALATVPHYNVYRAAFELRYSPGSRTPISRGGRESQFSLAHDAPVFKLTQDLGFLDDRYSGGTGFFINRTELTAEKRFWFSSFGHLDARVQTGMVWNRVPFTELYIPPTSTSIFLAQNAFNLMQPMEFLMDQYVGLFATYYFKGWILNRIPGINKLKLRGVVSFSGIYGGLTDKNNPYLPSGNGLYVFPDANMYVEQGQTGEFNMRDQGPIYVSGNVSSPIGKLPYMELTAGFENIFKFLRIDYVRRLTYNDYMLPDGIHARRLGPWGRNGVKVSFRLAL